MTTTLAIDDDLLAIAQEKAEREQKSVGEVVSIFMRKGIDAEEDMPEPVYRNGILLLPRNSSSRPVSVEYVQELMEELL